MADPPAQRRAESDVQETLEIDRDAVLFPIAVACWAELFLILDRFWLGRRIVCPMRWLLEALFGFGLAHPHKMRALALSFKRG